ncbi:MAG: ATP-dependent DNA helicase RecG [Angelakisella sp.]
MTFDSDIRYVKGVGEARMKLYNHMGLFTVEDLLYHLPRNYLDLRNPCTIATAPVGETAAVAGIVSAKSGEQRIRKGLSIWKVQLVDGNDRMTVTFYNAKFTVAALKVGEEYLFYGRVGGTLLRKELLSPAVHPITSCGLLPIYPLTKGLTSRAVATNVSSALAQLGTLPEPLPETTIRRYGLPSLDEALRTVHQPENEAALSAARRRLIFEELLCLALGLSSMRRGREVIRVTPMAQKSIEPFFAALPFSLTGGQQASILDSLADMCSGLPMNRLVQGDVGSGKTMVAAACCYFAHLNGFSSAIMAPTELLAEQHYRTLSPLLASLGMRVGLLTGSLPQKEKRLVKAALAAGELDLCIGTHALITADTVWQRLGLVVTDEQHRFGVAQRMSLSQKGRETHTLVMSATPIPRTLGLIIYGDMELSVIRELPKGRQPIETYLIDSGKRNRAFGYIKKHLDKGLQGFIVCPLVEEDEELPDSNRKAAEQWMSQLTTGPFKDYRLGLLHGKMKAKDKDAVMAAFAAGQLDLLVATTVIEVGIDVPSAVIMMIENAESFGLSQLHQLRGRVGRGSHQSTCILLTDSKNPETLDRLHTLCKTTDGFAIAEYDLATRGPGDFFGMRQSGLPQLRVANLSQDIEVLEQTRTEAAGLLENDPTLDALPLLRKRIEKMMKTAVVL